MPRKTKREKILASQHRQILLAKQPTSENQPAPAKINIPKLSLPEQKPPENSFFFGDLKKSLILTTIVVALEIALYFAKLIK